MGDMDKHLWVLVGAQMDVTLSRRSGMPRDHKVILHQIGSKIRRRLVRMLGELGLMEMLGRGIAGKKGAWKLVPDVIWKPGALDGDEVEKSLAAIPPHDVLTKELRPLVGLSQRCFTSESLPPVQISVQSTDRQSLPSPQPSAQSADRSSQGC